MITLNTTQVTLTVNKSLEYVITVLLCIEEDMFINRQSNDLKRKQNKDL